jgi:hypothetical protein
VFIIQSKTQTETVQHHYISATYTMFRSSGPLSFHAAPSSRMATSSGDIDVRKPTQGKKSVGMPLPSVFKSLGPLNKQPTRNISDSTASTAVATDFSENEEDYQNDISPLEAADDWDLDISLHEQIEDEEYDTEDEDEYTIPLNDSSTTRPRLVDGARSCPKRREMLMDNYEQTMLQELYIVGRRSAR